MTDVRVKICGIRTEAALHAAVENGADWIGLVFHPPSPRHVGVRDAATLVRRLRNRIPAVGLFVDPDEDSVAAVLAEVPLDILQLYAPADRALSLRQRFGLPVWQALGVSRRADLPTDTALDGLVIEARPPPGSDRPGGNGVRLDWSILEGWVAPTPWLLAGGLTPDNVGAAIRIGGAAAVDVSSGVERVVGEKDPELIRAFVTAARAPQ